MLVPANSELLTVSAKELIDSEIGSQKQVNVQRLMQEMERNDFN
jgi:hypothetical protein